MTADVIEKDGYFYATCDPERYVAVPFNGGVDICVSGAYSLPQAEQIAEALHAAIAEVRWRRLCEGNVRAFGHPRPPRLRDDPVFIRRTSTGRTHVVRQSFVGRGEPGWIVAMTACGAAFDEDEFESVASADAPMCERCARSLEAQS